MFLDPLDNEQLDPMLTCDFAMLFNRFDLEGKEDLSKQYGDISFYCLGE